MIKRNVTISKLKSKAMKRYLLLLAVFVVPIIISCGSSREVSERRSLMMPRLSEVPRNAHKYRDVSYTKKNKNQKKTYKKRDSNDR
jgi:hypothetical protein